MLFFFFSPLVALAQSDNGARVETDFSFAASFISAVLEQVGYTAQSQILSSLSGELEMLGGLILSLIHI